MDFFLSCSKYISINISPTLLGIVVALNLFASFLFFVSYNYFGIVVFLAFKDDRKSKGKLTTIDINDHKSNKEG